jgi:hypothetical protein
MHQFFNINKFRHPMKKKNFIVIIYCLLSFSGNSQIYGTGNGDGFAYNCIEWSQPILVPVRLVSFEAICSEKGQILNWSVEAIDNVNNFAVEKSSDGLHFYTVAILPAIQNTGETNHYRFADDSARNIKSFYRLKQTSRSGQTEYSRIISVNCGGNSSFDVDIFPNPTTGLLSIRSKGLNSSQQKAALIIRNIFGQSLLFTTLKPDMTLINIGHLPEGIYFAEIQTSEGSSFQKIILHKN